MYGIFLLRNPPGFLSELQRVQRVPSLFTQEEHTGLSHIMHDRLPNREPQIWQSTNWFSWATSQI